MRELLKRLLETKKETTTLFKRNVLKEYLQVLVLSFIYSHKEYQSLVFYGGSCLRHCFNLPRLSEDLDFVDIRDKVDMNKLAEDIKGFFEKRVGLKIGIRVQKFSQKIRLTVKFPILYELNLAEYPESDFLFLKIEVYKEFDFCKAYQIQIIPLFKFGESVLVRTFDLPTLMATKIRAILYRKWEKTTKDGRILASVKGRDYYDLMWYLEKEVKPNLKCIES